MKLELCKSPARGPRPSPARAWAQPRLAQAWPKPGPARPGPGSKIINKEAILNILIFRMGVPILKIVRWPAKYISGHLEPPQQSYSEKS